MTYRPLLTALVVASLTVVPAHADERVVAIIHAAAAAHGVSGAQLERTLRCESNLRSGAVGAAGELGIAQLHPQGLLPVFRQQGFGDPFNAQEAIEFTAWAFSQGYAPHWTCWRRGR